MRSLPSCGHLTLTPATAQAAAISSCTRTYTVKSGDTCKTIAGSQGVSSFQLLKVNPVKSGDFCADLKYKDEICLASIEYDCHAVYQVKQGDYCYGIAEKSKITL